MARVRVIILPGSYWLDWKGGIDEKGEGGGQLNCTLRGHGTKLTFSIREAQ